MAWLLAVLVIAVIGGVAVVAVGGVGAPLSPSYDDRPDVEVPATGPLTGADLRGLRFTSAVRGYRASEVDALLERLARQLDGVVPEEPVVSDGDEPGTPAP